MKDVRICAFTKERLNAAMEAMGDDLDKAAKLPDGEDVRRLQLKTRQAEQERLAHDKEQRKLEKESEKAERALNPPKRGRPRKAKAEEDAPKLVAEESDEVEGGSKKPRKSTELPADGEEVAEAGDAVEKNEKEKIEEAKTAPQRAKVNETGSKKPAPRKKQPKEQPKAAAKKRNSRKRIRDEDSVPLNAKLAKKIFEVLEEFKDKEIDREEYRSIFPYKKWAPEGVSVVVYWERPAVGIKVPSEGGATPQTYYFNGEDECNSIAAMMFCAQKMVQKLAKLGEAEFFSEEACNYELILRKASRHAYHLQQQGKGDEE